MGDEPKDDTTEKKERKTAAAIQYEPEHFDAPRLIAKGFGIVAERIIELAKRYSIPIHFDPDLSSLLTKLKIDTEIPKDLYRAVAEVLALLYRANRAKAEQNNR